MYKDRVAGSAKKAWGKAAAETAEGRVKSVAKKPTAKQ